MANSKKSNYKIVNIHQHENRTVNGLSPNGLGKRHVQALLLFLCMSVAFMLRAHMSVTLVAMTTNPKSCSSTQSTLVPSYNETDLTEPNITTRYNCSDTISPRSTITRWNVYQTYNWTESHQHMIIFAFFVGYTTMMIPMGLTAHRFGGKATILLTLTVNGIVSLFTPWMPLLGGWALVAAGRLLQGMTQAAMYPSVHTLLAHWAPLAERGRISTYVYAGAQVGTVAAFQAAGQLAGGTAGWPATLWVCAAFSLTAAGLLAIFGAATPDDHPSISAEEKMYIAGHDLASPHERRPTPWRHILTSSAVWGLFVAQAGSATSYLFIFTQTPVYMSRVIGLDIKNNGLYSSLPYVAMYATNLMFGWAADLCIARGMRVANVRRIANTIGLAVSGGFLALFSMVRSPLTAEMLLITCMALHSSVHVGFHINHIDLAPNFAGPMMSVGNMLANLAGLSVPIVVSNFVHNLSDQKQWQKAFLTVAGVEILANGVFVLLVRGDVQPWNDLPQRSHSYDINKDIENEENILCMNEQKIMTEEK